MNNKPGRDPFSGSTLERVPHHCDEGRWSVAYPVGAAGNELCELSEHMELPTDIIKHSRRYQVILCR